MNLGLTASVEEGADADKPPEAQEFNSTDYTDANQNNIVPSGEPGGANTVKSIKSKKIPSHKRTTTPYMTKYERARVLGTRALQIR